MLSYANKNTGERSLSRRNGGKWKVKCMIHRTQITSYKKTEKEEKERIGEVLCQNASILCSMKTHSESFCLCVCLSMNLSVYLSLSVYLCISIYLYLCIYPSLSIFVCFPIFIYLYPCIYPSLSILVCLSISISLYLCIYSSLSCKERKINIKVGTG